MALTNPLPKKQIDEHFNITGRGLAAIDWIGAALKNINNALRDAEKPFKFHVDVAPGAQKLTTKVDGINVTVTTFTRPCRWYFVSLPNK